jgi:spoIIIJ-associated protein
MRESKYANDTAITQIESFLEQTLENLDLDVEFEIIEADPSEDEDFETPELIVNFTGPDTELMLEYRAELLLALEHLTMEMLRMPPEDHSLICFDANDWRRLRIEELRMSATTAAERVKKSKQPFTFSPMNSRERRIIHLAMRNEPELRSESVGSGSHRQVVLLPVDMPLPPAPPFTPSRGAPRGLAAMATAGYRPDPESNGDSGGRDRGDRRGPRRGGPGGGGGRGGPRGGGGGGGRDRRGPRRG